jgi:hypothetical protein
VSPLSELSSPGLFFAPLFHLLCLLTSLVHPMIGCKGLHFLSCVSYHTHHCQICHRNIIRMWMSINSVLSSLLSFCHYVFRSPILCNVCGKYINRHLMNSIEANVCLFTKKLAFKRTYKGQTVVFFTYNATEKGHKI